VRLGFKFQGAVECSSSQGGGDTTAQPSSSPSMTGNTTQDRDRGSSSDRDDDSDGDRIPDSSDNCAHNSNPRCYKEAT
jgi:hypothetical protein